MYYYILIIISTLMWSFVGVLVKTANTMVNSSIITFCRFFFGVVFLGIFLLWKNKKIQLQINNKFIWIAVIGKSCNYIFENIAIHMGFSYGNVLVWPVQAIFLAIVSVLYFKESISMKKITTFALCILGIFFVSWNGAPMDQLWGKNALITLLFVLAAIGNGTYVVCQKKIIDQMDAGDMNFSIFLLCSLATGVIVPFDFQVGPTFQLGAVAALVTLGFITGISFYLNAAALKKVPLFVISVINTSCVIFTLCWSVLFFQEPITRYIVIGVLLFVGGLVYMNLPERKILPAYEEVG